MLGCVGSSWGRTPTHRALSSQHPAFLLPKPPAGFSRLCRRLPDSMALHPHHPGIFCLTQVFCSIHYILCASQAACSRLLVSGPGPAVLPRPEKATGILPTTSPEALTGSTCRELKILGPRALSLTGDAAMGMGEQLGHGFSPGCWILRCSAKLHPALLKFTLAGATLSGPHGWLLGSQAVCSGSLSQTLLTSILTGLMH